MKDTAETGPATPASATDPSELLIHKRIGHDLIPLQHWSSRDLEGRERGKSPRDTGWRAADYSGFDACAHIAAGGNVGVRLRPTDLVIDVDNRNFDEGDDPLRRLADDCGLKLSAYPTVLTGGGGRHYYLTKPAGTQLATSLDDYPGIELKSFGAQAVAAGSVHPSGHLYRWDDFTAEEALEAPAELLARFAKPARPPSSGGGEHTPEQIAAMLAALDVRKFASNDEWFRLMASVHHASAGDARQEFLEWSAGDGRYASSWATNARRWDSLHAATNGAACTVKTLHHIMRQHGAEHAIPRTDPAADFDPVSEADTAGLPAPPSALARELETNKSGAVKDTIGNALEAVSKAGLGVAWNELKQMAVFTAPTLPWDERKYGRTLDENNLRMARLLLIERYRERRYEPSKDNVLEALMTVAYGNAFNPIADYLDGLRWDGQPHIHLLAGRYLNCGGGDYEEAVSRCFMIGAVRRIRRPGCKFDILPIISGPQGWNKSSAVRELFGAAWFSDAALPDL